MATQTDDYLSILSGVDLSASAWCGVTVDTTGKLALPAAGAQVIGILQNKPVLTNTSNNAAKYGSVRVAGMGSHKMKAGGTVTAGDALKVDSAGKFITASAADVAAGMKVGTALESAIIGDVFEGILSPSGGASSVTGFDDIVLGTTAPSNLTTTTYAQTTGTKTGVLANGVSPGQTKRIIQSVAATSPVGTITGTFLTLAGAAATTLALGTAVGTIVDLVWTGAAWRATSAITGTGSSLS